MEPAGFGGGGRNGASGDRVGVYGTNVGSAIYNPYEDGIDFCA
jgi:hypothetical protein